ncbi:MAG: 50S ribosomal protein L6 [Dehalococcoidia bacterium]|nr:50S ribosomal protein L6 [Dehalococcoidia bacterium]
MSHIGIQPVAVPKNVKVSVEGKNRVTVAGPLGSLTETFRPEVRIQLVDSQVKVERGGDSKLHRSLHGLTRAMIANMVVGVTQGYEKNLEIFGTGYRVQQTGANLTFQLGFSHPVVIQAPAGVKLAAVTANRVAVTGTDKQQVGETAARLRSIRPPDPYKGKGVRYAGETLKLKPGKAAARK